MSRISEKVYGTKRIYNKNFNDDDVILWDVLNIKKQQKVLVRFICSNSKYRQGIRIAIDVGDGSLSTNGVKGKAFDIWMDECPDEFIIDCESDRELLSVYNIFERNEFGINRRCSQMAYSGMILEQNDNIYKYKCNDTGANTNFDKMIFEIELL